jgi:hypothetical protein
MNATTGFGVVARSWFCVLEVASASRRRPEPQEGRQPRLELTPSERTVGGGVGITGHGAFRVATETTQIAGFGVVARSWFCVLEVASASRRRPEPQEGRQRQTITDLGNFYCYSHHQGTERPQDMAKRE